jgi:hypothetical protein
MFIYTTNDIEPESEIYFDYKAKCIDDCKLNFILS